MDPLPPKFHFSPALCQVALADGSVRMETNMVAAEKELQTDSAK